MGKWFDRLYAVVDVLLLLTTVGILIYNIIAITGFGDEIAGPVAGLVVFSITIQGITLFAILIGLRAFFIKAQMWIITSNALLCGAMCFTIIGATFFTVLADKLNNDDEGFRKIAADIGDNFERQVFNDCCVPLFAGTVPLLAADFVGASFGDIVSQELCDTLEDNEGETFVGAGLVNAESCGNDGNGVLIFDDFQEDFEDFTTGFYSILQGILWTQATLMLLSFLLKCSQMSCAAPDDYTKEEEDENPEVDMSGLGNNFPTFTPGENGREPSMMPPPNTGGPLTFGGPPRPPPAKPLIPHNVRNYIGGLSARFGRTSENQDGATGGGGGGFMKQVSARFGRPQMPNRPNMFGGSNKSKDVVFPAENGYGAAPPLPPQQPTAPPGIGNINGSSRTGFGSAVTASDKQELWRSI